jgi:flagellar hook-associated protein 1 FlgK
MSLFVTLRSVAETMRAYERGMTISQNNVANAYTPGYARQVQSLQARPFDLRQGRMGGVESGLMINSRSGFAERNVWRESSLTAEYSARRDRLMALEASFPIQEGAGVPAALDRFFGSFSEASVSPNSPVFRLTILQRARDLAARFQESATGLNESARNTGGAISSAVDKINSIAARITEINIARRNNYEARNEPGSDAALHDALEQLSEVADFTLLEQPDGTVSVYLGGQSVLAIGDRYYPISADISGGPAVIRDADGLDITNRLRSGHLGALIDFRNNLVPAYQTELDALATGLAGQVNALLASGVDLSGLPPTVDLFTFTGPPGASTFTVSGITGDELALATAGAPGGNGNAILIAQLADAPTMSGLTFRDFYSRTASEIGRGIAANSQNASVHEMLLTQARALRADLSGVSLDEEAAKLIEFQRAYQAATQMFRIVDEMTQMLLSIKS